jgi:hypothetical protein
MGVDVVSNLDGFVPPLNVNHNEACHSCVPPKGRKSKVSQRPAPGLPPQSPEICRHLNICHRKLSNWEQRLIPDLSYRTARDRHHRRGFDERTFS